MRVVHLTLSTTAQVTGGLEYHIAYLTEALKRRGHDVIVVSMNSVPGSSETRKRSLSNFRSRLPGGACGRAQGPDGLFLELAIFSETVATFLRRLFNGRNAISIANYVESLKPDIVHQHSYIGGLAACLLISKKFPIVFTNHTGAYLYLEKLAPTRFVQRQVMKRFSKVIGPSRQLLPRTHNSVYVPNGVDTSKFFPVSEAERARLKTKHKCAGKRVFLCPRRWAPTKGIVFLARALRYLSLATRDNCVFLFAGNETSDYVRYRRCVESALSRAGCNVRILGNVAHTELAELMNISDACVFPSLMEATSLACLEAMACAAPVIGSETGGLIELIRHGENGWLVPARDHRALAARIDDVAQLEAGSSRRVGIAGLKTVRERYTWSAAALETERIYDETLRKWREQRGKSKSSTNAAQLEE